MNQDLLNILYNKFENISFDSYLLKNHQQLASLFSLVDSSLGANISIPYHTKFSWEYTLKLEEVFLCTLNTSYKDSFKMDVAKGKIVQEKCDSGYYHRNFDLSEYKIYIPENFNISDFVVLSHEYTHHLSSLFPRKEEDSSAYFVYCEMLATLGELKSLDFLRVHNVSNYEINAYIQHMRTNYQNIYYVFSLVQPLLNLYLSKHKFTSEDILHLFYTVPFYSSFGVENMISNLEMLVSKDLEKCFLGYVHLLGMIWASSLHQSSISDEEFSLLINHINDLEVEIFEKILPDKSPRELATDIQKEFRYKRC